MQPATNVIQLSDYIIPRKPADREKATCRGCGRELQGTPYHLGGSAYHPDTGDRCPASHYGGWVCSERCDRDASMEMQQSMPGCTGYTPKHLFDEQEIRAKWS